MIKSLSTIFLIFFSGFMTFAQSNLEIKGSGSKLYLEHNVIPKENFYSIGRLYNAPPKDIASFNNLQFENGLSVGQVIRIPLTENNFTQSETARKSSEMIPIYHSVQAKEGLYRLSINYNKIPLSLLKKWNKLGSDEVSVGTPLVVGYLRVDKNQSAMAGNQGSNNGQTDAKDAGRPAPESPQVTNVSPKEISKDNPANDIVVKGAPKTPVSSTRAKSDINFSGGYFRKLYENQVAGKNEVNESGSGGIFKSTSGWQDGKYYCFNNEAPPGTIIKVTDNSSGKSVFAKVLDAIPELQQNAGLAVIISNSAAEELGTGENVFNCAISFAK